MNLIVGTGILAAELVARESEDSKVFGVLGLQLLVEFLETFELGSKAALGGSVDDEDGLALERGEGKRRAFLYSSGGQLVSVPYARDTGDWEGGDQQNVLSTGSKSKKVVAEAMVCV